ncbi:MAG: beta-ketoacyl synthase chain length factor [Epsilonproteobacteria bacterium]|nr:beta-ketoacyl synthase chain length factor [Campylobacterota bacterium]
MKSVAINIISSAKIYAKEKIEDLEDKRLVPKMMMRRRLTRNAKVMLYLSDKCGFKNGKIVYGTCFSELEETAKIANAVLENRLLSPTSFQNSVYNTAPSYFSIINKDKDEIITISSGMKTSKEALKTAALQALVFKCKVLCVCVECINIRNIQEINHCTSYLEAGVAVVLEVSENIDDALEVETKKTRGLIDLIDSLQDLMSVVKMYEEGKNKILVEL